MKLYANSGQNIPVAYKSAENSVFYSKKRQYRCSNINETILPMERVTGIGPAYSAWEADVLPLNYTRRKQNSPAKTELLWSW